MSQPFLQVVQSAKNDAALSLFDALRAKWTEVPAGLGARAKTTQLLSLSPVQLRAFWKGVHSESTRGPGYSARGWYQEIYRSIFAGKRVLEIGSGMGIDAVPFVASGAEMHCADISSDNLQLISRACEALGLPQPGLTTLTDLSSFESLPYDFDFIYCQGSLINTPLEFARVETRLLLPHLRPGGRWVELAYPRERWEREGSLPFEQWGAVTDGEGTPWVEWYDADRLRARFAPTRFEPVLALNFHNDDFNWFDLRVDDPPTRVTVSEAYEEVGNQASADCIEVDLTTVSCQDHNGSKIEASSGGLTVISAPDLWSYAIHFEVKDLLVGGPREDRMLQVEVNVEGGYLGVGLLDSALSSYVTPELVLNVAPGVQTVSLPVTVASQFLMFRNVGGGGEEARFRVCSMRSVRRDTPEADKKELEFWGPASASVHLPSTLGGLSSDDLDRGSGIGWVEVVRPSQVASELGLDIRLADRPEGLLRDSLEWRMDPEDAQLLAAIYRAAQPNRHLEIGTWEGFGVVLCAQNAPGVEITTINLPDGEISAEGTFAYPGGNGQPSGAGERIGRLYREAGLGVRVRQVYADSTTWEPDVPDGSFDSVLIDGGHSSEVVVADTALALRLTRPGGLILWHDFCPVERALNQGLATRGVVTAINRLLPSLGMEMDRLFWVRPSFLLVGRRAGLVE